MLGLVEVELILFLGGVGMTKEKLLEYEDNKLNDEIIKLRKENGKLKHENSFLKEKLMKIFMCPKDIIRLDINFKKAKD